MASVPPNWIWHQKHKFSSSSWLCFDWNVKYSNPSLQNSVNCILKQHMIYNRHALHLLLLSYIRIIVTSLPHLFLHIYTICELLCIWERNSKQRIKSLSFNNTQCKKANNIFNLMIQYGWVLTPLRKLVYRRIFPSWSEKPASLGPNLYREAIPYFWCCEVADGVIGSSAHLTSEQHSSCCTPGERVGDMKRQGG